MAGHSNGYVTLFQSETKHLSCVVTLQKGAIQVGGLQPFSGIPLFPERPVNLRVECQKSSVTKTLFLRPVEKLDDTGQRFGLLKRTAPGDTFLFFLC